MNRLSTEKYVPAHLQQEKSKLRYSKMTFEPKTVAEIPNHNNVLY